MLKKPGSYIILTAVIGVIVIAVRAPLYHNPDANYYYGTALILAHGQLLASVEAKHGPLLSWLMAPLIALGLPITSAFRVVNCIAYGSLLLATRSIALKISLTKLEIQLAVALVALHTLYLTVSVITPDLLGASLYLWFCYLFLTDRGVFKVGGLGALTYYAKAIFLPIVVLVLAGASFFSFFKKRSALALKKHLLIVGIVVLIALPWCLALSLTYKAPIFSGQQLIIKHPVGRHFYSPRNKAALIEGEAFSAEDRRYGPTIPVTRLDSIAKAAPYLYATTKDLLFGPDAIHLYIALVLFNLLSCTWWASFSTLIIFSWGYFIPHFIIWGAYLRYFLPVLPLFHLIAVHQYFLLIKRCRRKSLRWGVAALGGVAIASTVTTTVTAINADWSDRLSQRIDEKVEVIAGELEGDGVVAGNISSELPPLAAYKRRREFWGVLDPKLGDSSEELREKLDKWDVSTIIWVGPRWPLLESLTEVELQKNFSLYGEEVTIYNYD